MKRKPILALELAAQRDFLEASKRILEEKYRMFSTAVPRYFIGESGHLEIDMQWTPEQEAHLARLNEAIADLRKHAYQRYGLNPEDYPTWIVPTGCGL